MNGHTAALIFAALISAPASAQVALPDIDGRQVRPLENSRAKAVVFLFTRSDCPISNRYAPEVERLHSKFAPGGFDFWLVYVDPTESDDAIRRHVRAYGYHFGALIDRKHALVSLAKPAVTPEAAVYVNGRLVYRGRIDNRYSSFGKARQAATEHDLEQTLEAIADGRPLTPRTTRAVGCFIEDLK